MSMNPLPGLEDSTSPVPSETLKKEQWEEQEQWGGKRYESGCSAVQQVDTFPAPCNEGIASLYPIHHLILNQLIALVPFKTLQLSRYFYSRTIPHLYRHITARGDIFKGLRQVPPIARRSYDAFTRTRSVNFADYHSLCALNYIGESRPVFPTAERVEFAWSTIEDLSGLEYDDLGEELWEFATNFGPALREVVIHVQPPTFKPSQYYLRGRGEGEDDEWDTIEVIVTSLKAKNLTFVVHGSLQEMAFRRDLAGRIPVHWFLGETLRVVLLTREIALDAKALGGDRLYLAPEDDLVRMLGSTQTNHPFDHAINHHLIRILHPEILHPEFLYSEFPWIEDSYAAKWPYARGADGIETYPAKIEYHVWGAAAAEKGFRAKPLLPSVRKALDDGKVAFVQLEQPLLSQHGWKEGLMPGAATWNGRDV